MGRGQAPGRQLGGQFRAGPPRQRHPGGGGQLAGQRDHRGPLRCADPPRPPGAGQVIQPVQAAAGEPAPPLAHSVRLIPRSAAIRALSRPRAAASTICARSRSRQGVFAPRTRFFRVCARRGQRDRHRGSGMAASRADHSGVIRSRARDDNRPGAAARHNGAHARHPGIDPQLDHLAAAGPRGKALASAGKGAGQLPGRLRLPRRRPPRRRASSRYAGCATAAPPTPSASRSTQPPTTATGTPS